MTKTPQTDTLVARACLGILLHINSTITRHSLADFPLAEYAAQYWIDHARFEGVSQTLEEGVKQLFDPSLVHFSIWNWIHDPIRPRTQCEREDRPRPYSSPRSLLHMPLFGFARCCGISGH